MDTEKLFESILCGIKQMSVTAAPVRIPSDLKKVPLLDSALRRAVLPTSPKTPHAVGFVFHGTPLRVFAHHVEVYHTDTWVRCDHAIDLGEPFLEVFACACDSIVFSTAAETVCLRITQPPECSVSVRWRVPEPCSCIAISEETGEVAVVSANRRTVWRMHSGRRVAVETGDIGAVHALSFVKDDLVMADEDGDVFIVGGTIIKEMLSISPLPEEIIARVVDDAQHPRMPFPEAPVCVSVHPSGTAAVATKHHLYMLFPRSMDDTVEHPVPHTQYVLDAAMVRAVVAHDRMIAVLRCDGGLVMLDELGQTVRNEEINGLVRIISPCKVCKCEACVMYGGKIPGAFTVIGSGAMRVIDAHGGVRLYAVD